jgi:hypothetical protein
VSIIAMHARGYAVFCAPSAIPASASSTTIRAAC